MYYARYKKLWWKIYKKRKFWFDKVVYDFRTVYPVRVYQESIEPELERLKNEGWG